MNNKILRIPILSLLLLTACTTEKVKVTHVSNHKPAPKKCIDIKPQHVAVNEVKTKQEPLSRYGNPESYKLFGHTYRVMRSAGGYKTKGIASWYGTEFHKKRTSSGEKYDMYAMTAAHKTLPLPTYVKVTNLHNHREAIVKINDRGPFHKDRVIDLSYAAAKKLGILDRGIAPVEVVALTKEKTKAHYYVQAGAFKTEKLASSLQNKIARIVDSPIAIKKYEDHFVVRLGPFTDKESTEKLKKKLASNGVEGTFSTLQ